MYSEGDLKRLVDLGISEKTARAALEEQRGDVAKAADLVRLFTLFLHLTRPPRPETWAWRKWSLRSLRCHGLPFAKVSF